MKKSLLLFVLIFVAYSLTGRENPRKSVSSDLIKQNTVKSAMMTIPALRLANSLTENWLETSEWENSTKTELTYSPNLKVATKSNWNTTNSVWDLSFKSETTLDANGRTTLQLNYSRAGGVWINSSKVEMAYNASGDLIQYAYWTWIGSAWVGFMKLELTYDASHNLISDLGYDYNLVTSSWEVSDKTDYIYTGGNNTQDLSYTWDKTLSTPAWVNSYKSDYTYNGSNKMTVEIDWVWDKTLAVPGWVYESKSEWGYDAAGNMNLEITYDWNKLLSVPAWEGSMKTDYVYDANKNITSITVSMWDGVDWIFSTKSESTYTTNQTVTLISDWNELSVMWDLKARTTDNYSDATAIEKHAEKGIKLYPNPARDYFVIESESGPETATIQIFNLQGRKVLEQKQSAERQIIQSAGLKKGLYLYRINVNGKVTSGKLLIE